jgi:hypothetical protein
LPVARDFIRGAGGMARVNQCTPADGDLPLTERTLPTAGDRTIEMLRGTSPLRLSWLLISGRD